MVTQDLVASLGVIQPELVLAGAALLCILADLVWKDPDKSLCWLLAALGIVGALAATILSWGIRQTGFYDLVRMDNFANFFSLIFLASGLLTLFLSDGFVRRERIAAGEYYSLLLVCLCGMLFMASANDLMTVFVGLELMSIPVYILSGLLKSEPKSPEAALKYLLLGAFASAFLLFGIALTYGAAGTTNLPALLEKLAGGDLGASPMFLAGAGLLLVGLGFKVSLVPFHMWTPDVYEGAPTSVTAFMSVAVKAAGFSILIRIVVLSLQPLAADWSKIFWCLAVATMVLGNVVALVQENIKRMLAYSSIAHAGYVLVALTPGTEAGVKAALIYLFIYFLMNLGAFGVVIALGRKGDRGVEIEEYAGLARRHPVYGLVMAVFMFSLAGVPPTGGFIGKFYAFSAAIRSGYIWLAVIGVLMSAVSAYFYLRVLVVMYMREPGPKAPEPRFADLPGAALGLSISLLVCTAAVLALGVWPGPLAQIAQKAVNGLFPSL